MRLRRRLAVVVAIALAPSLLLTLYNAARWRIFLEREARAAAQSEAHFAAAELGQVIESGRQLMAAMAKYPLTADNDDSCSTFFKSVMSGAPIVREAAIVDGGGRPHCATASPTQELGAAASIALSGDLTAGKLTVRTAPDRTTHLASIDLSMPYQDSGGAKGAIVLILNSHKLAENLATHSWQPDHRLVIMDGNGALALTLPITDFQATADVAKLIAARTASAADATVEIPDPTGRPLIVGFAEPGGASAGLFAAVVIDRDSALADTSLINMRGIAFDFGALIVAVIGVWLAAYLMIDRPIRAIIRSAGKREAGDTAAQFPKFRFSDEFGQLSAALSRMSDRIDELLKQKDLLLREIQHRVMNSLNLLSGLLDMQRRSVGNASAKAHLANARDRVVAMGTVYSELYHANTLESVNFSEFLDTICSRSEAAYAGANRPPIKVDAESLELSSANAISLGMLTHELITNALKHAYTDGESGPIKVTLKHKKEGGVDLRISDRGKGLPSNFKIDGKSSSLGMKVIASTVRQLGGKLEINRLKPGTEFAIHLPANIEHRA